MDERVTYERLPVFTLEIGKHETDIPHLDAMVEHFRARIAAHRYARFIGVFDHFAHTSGLADGEVAAGIVGARNVVFCFGLAIPRPDILALRPRSIGLAELADRFVVSFLETPMPLVNSAMEAWARALARA